MNEPVLDSAIFDEMSELMGDALSDFIETFLDNSPKLLARIEKALEENDFDTVYQNAHQLKGGSGSIGTMQVFSLSKQLEQKGKEKDEAGMVEMFAQLQQAYEQAATALTSHL